MSGRSVYRAAAPMPAMGLMAPGHPWVRSRGSQPVDLSIAPAVVACGTQVIREFAILTSLVEVACL